VVKYENWSYTIAAATTGTTMLEVPRYLLIAHDTYRRKENRVRHNLVAE